MDRKLYVPEQTFIDVHGIVNDSNHIHINALATERPFERHDIQVIYGLDVPAEPPFDVRPLFWPPNATLAGFQQAHKRFGEPRDRTPPRTAITLFEITVIFVVILFFATIFALLLTATV